MSDHDAPHITLRPKRKAAATANNKNKRTALGTATPGTSDSESKLPDAGLTAPRSQLSIAQIPSPVTQSDGSPLTSTATDSPSPPVENVRQLQRSGGSNASLTNLRRQAVENNSAKNQKSRGKGGKDKGGKGGKDGEAEVQLPKMIIKFKTSEAKGEPVNENATPGSASSQAVDTPNSDTSIRRSNRDRKAAMPRQESPSIRAAPTPTPATRVKGQQKHTGKKSETPIVPSQPPEQKGQPRNKMPDKAPSSQSRGKKRTRSPSQPPSESQVAPTQGEGYSQSQMATTTPILPLPSRKDQPQNKLPVNRPHSQSRGLSESQAAPSQGQGYSQSQKQSMTPILPPPQLQGQPRPRGNTQPQAIQHQSPFQVRSQTQSQASPPSIRPRLQARRHNQSQDVVPSIQGPPQSRQQIQSRQPATQNQGRPQTRRESQSQASASQIQGQPESRADQYHGLPPPALVLHIQRANQHRPGPVNVQAANASANLQSQVRSNVQGPSPRIYNQIAHLQGINQHLDPPHEPGIQHLIQRALGPRNVSANAAGRPGPGNINNNQGRRGQGNQQRRQDIPKIEKKPTSDAFGLLKSMERDLIEKVNPYQEDDLRRVSTATKIFQSMREAFAAPTPRPKQAVPMRQPPSPEIYSLAIGQLKRVQRPPPNAPIFDNEQLRVPIYQVPTSKQDSGVCTFCHFDCDYGISDTRVWLPEEASTGFCRECHSAPTSFYEEWKSNLSNFIYEKTDRGAQRLLELDRATNEPPFVEVTKTMDFRGVSGKITGRVFPRDDDLDSDHRVMSEIDRTKDITKYMVVQFCRGNPWRQVDCHQARICDDCRREKLAIIKHRHTEFSPIVETGDSVDAWGEDARPDPRERRCMICTNLAGYTCDACPLRVCVLCKYLLTKQCKGHLNFVFYHYYRTHLRNDAFLLRSDGGGF